MNLSEQTSKRITALRFLLIVLVVCIHNDYNAESIAKILEGTGHAIVFNQSVWGKWVQLFISTGIGRAAVPLCFLFSAFLLSRGGILMDGCSKNARGR